MFQSRNKSVSHKLQKFLWPKKGFQRSFFYLRERISRMSASTHALALGLACGAAASMTPFIGFHIFLAALLAYIFGGNIFASAIGTVVGNPWSFPLIWAADAYAGDIIIQQFGLANWLGEIDASVQSEIPVTFFYKLSVGGAALAIISFPLFYGVSYWGLSSWRGHRLRKAEQRALAKRQSQEIIAPNIASTVASHDVSDTVADKGQGTDNH